MMEQQPDIDQFAQQVINSLVQLFGYTTDYAQRSVQADLEFVREKCVNYVEATDVAGMIACKDANIEEAAKAIPLHTIH